MITGGADGNLAGTVSDLYNDMVNVIRFGIPEEKAILAATLTPAKEVGRDTEIGSMEPGEKQTILSVIGTGT